MLVIASVGLNSDEDKIRKMILAGADVFRYNFSYDTLEKNLELIEKNRSLIEDLNASTKELIELPLNKIRLGDFDLKIFSVRENEEIVFQSGPFSPDCNEFIPVNIPYLGENVRIHQTISLGNGRVSMQVIEIINRDAVKMRILNNGIVKAFQTFNNNIFLADSEILNTYEQIIKKITPLQPDFLSVPYISQEFIQTIKNTGLFSYLSFGTKMVINIGKEISEAEIEMLCTDPTFNIINIDRGELGVSMPFEKFGIFQKRITAYAKKYTKPLFFSAHILPSIIDNYIPTRSDITDLTNIVCDDAAGIIFSKETNSGNRPAYAISVAKKIINEVERAKKIFINCQ